MAELVKYAVGAVVFYALGDRVIIKQDPFRTGYECEGCNGSGKAPCGACNGSGASPRVREARCATCGGTGALMCTECEGKGGLLVAPEVSQRRPTTGTVVSAGPDCKVLKVGDSVMYSNFAGYTTDLHDGVGEVSLRILHETEVLCGVEGHLEVRRVRQQREALTR